MVFKTCGLVKGGLLNIQSAKNKMFEIKDTVVRCQFDICAVTETQLTDFDSAVIEEMTPVTHTFLHKPRVAGCGGGVGLFISNLVKRVRAKKTPVYNSFELLHIEAEINGNKLTFTILYNPPATSPSLFLEEFADYLETADMVGVIFTILGDFNYWLADLETRYVQQFTDVIALFGLVNVVNKPTSVCGHTIDLVLVDPSKDIVRDLQVDDVCTISPVQKLVLFKLDVIL